MKLILNSLAFLSFLITVGQTDKLDVITAIDKSLKEVSAAETTQNSSLIWVIEDAGNKNEVYGINLNGKIKRTIAITNVKNDDWEDLTSDTDGNLYIGDFGNNSEKRKHFSIFKIESIETAKKTTTASIINFTLPKGVKSKDFEAFFLLNGYFYLFSKERKKAVVIKVPNVIGDHRATLVSKYYLKGKDTRVTSAAISADGKTVILLNHERIWKLTDFKGETFFGGKVKAIDLQHDSQKEGICFKSDTELYVTDERTKSEGGKIYSYKL